MANNTPFFSGVAGLYGSLNALRGLESALQDTQSAGSFLAKLQAAREAQDGAAQGSRSFEEMWKESFARHFGQEMGTTYYHVMDLSSIDRGTWCHNDFPRELFFSNGLDESVLDWRPTRGNPSQLDSDVQRRIGSTLGKHAIVVPPALEEKMKDDPELRRKVIENIDRVYAFHAPRPQLTMPGTKIYGTPIYSSVIVLSEDGEVSNCCVSSGGTMMGPDEETLRQIALERARKAKRKAYNRLLEEEAILKRIEMREMFATASMEAYWKREFGTVPVTSPFQFGLLKKTIKTRV